MFEHFASVLVTSKLIETCAGRSQQNHIARLCYGIGLTEGILQCLRVDDFDTAYQRMVAAGVRFVSPPRDEPYGKLAVFLDLEGNRWDLLGDDPRRRVSA